MNYYEISIFWVVILENFSSYELIIDRLFKIPSVFELELVEATVFSIVYKCWFPSGSNPFYGVVGFHYVPTVGNN